MPLPYKAITAFTCVESAIAGEELPPLHTALMLSDIPGHSHLKEEKRWGCKVTFRPKRKKGGPKQAFLTHVFSGTFETNSDGVPTSFTIDKIDHNEFKKLLT